MEKKTHGYGPAKLEESLSDKTKLEPLHPYAKVCSIHSAVKGPMPGTYTFNSAHLGGFETPTPNALFIYLISMTKCHCAKAKVQKFKTFFCIS